MRKNYLPLLFLAAFVLTGCDKEPIEQREENDPLVQAGQTHMDNQEWEMAINSFKEALNKEPLMARPHLDLATIYQNYKLNYFHAIYHYDRYLELRPDTEKREMIEEQKLKIAQALANTLIKNSPEVKELVNEVKKQRMENSQLKQELAALKREMAKAQEAPSQPVVKTTPNPEPVVEKSPAPAVALAPAPAAAPARSTGHQIYHVVGGDTLTKIAQKFYGTDNWEPIFEANRDTMGGNPGNLRVGQTLVIPGANADK